MKNYAALVLLFSLVSHTHAVLVFNMQEVGGGVVVTSSGSANTTDLLPSAFLGIFAFRQVDTGGGDGVFITNSGQVDCLTGISGPSAFGPGTGYPFDAINPSGASGDVFGFDGSAQFLIVPVGYVSGSPLSATTQFSQTISGLGVTPGIYTWTWGSGPNADSAILYAGVPIPEPATYIALVGFIGLGLFVWCRRKRAHQSAA